MQEKENIQNYTQLNSQVPILQVFFLRSWYSAFTETQQGNSWYADSGATKEKKIINVGEWVGVNSYTNVMIPVSSECVCACI